MKALTLLFLVAFSVFMAIGHCDLVQITGSMSPTGGIGLEENRYTVYVEIKIVELDPYESAFIPRVYLSMPNLFESKDPTPIDAEIELSGSLTDRITTNIFGANVGDYSIVLPGYVFRIIKNLILKITINDIKYMETNKNKEMKAFVDFYQSDSYFVERRVLLPFHPFSFVATEDDGKVVTRFTSSIGFQKTAYITFEYPTCMDLGSISSFVLCSSISYLSLKKTISSSAKCRVEGRTLIMKELERSYPESKEETIRFEIEPLANRGCGKNSHVKVTVFEREYGRELEQAVLFGFDQRPKSEIEMEDLEASYGTASSSLNLKVTLSFLFILLLLIL